MKLFAGELQTRQLSREEQEALRAEIGTDEDIFIFPALISNNQLDSHFSRMDISTLRNFAQDATKGVAFQNYAR